MRGSKGEGMEGIKSRKNAYMSFTERRRENRQSDLRKDLV